MVYGRLNADRAAARATGGMDPALLRRRLSFPLNLSAETKRVELSSPSDPSKRKNTNDRNHDGGPEGRGNAGGILNAQEGTGPAEAPRGLVPMGTLPALSTRRTRGAPGPPDAWG